VSRLADLVVEEQDGAIVARVTGEIDLSNAATLERGMLDAVPNTASGMVVDLTGVSYLDSAGIRMLGEMAERLRWREQRLAVVAPVGSRVRSVLTMAGAADVVAFEDSFDSALQTVVGGG
jgi:anti-anti-sigma factor